MCHPVCQVPEERVAFPWAKVVAKLSYLPSTFRRAFLSLFCNNCKVYSCSATLSCLSFQTSLLLLCLLSCSDNDLVCAPKIPKCFEAGTALSLFRQAYQGDLPDEIKALMKEEQSDSVFFLEAFVIELLKNLRQNPTCTDVTWKIHRWPRSVRHPSMAIWKYSFVLTQ